MTIRQTEARSSPFGSRLIILSVASIIAAIAILIGAGFNPWNVLFVDPLINVLILFNNIFFNQFGIAIIAFTILMRLVTLPLTVRQFKSTQAMQSIQPRMQELQKKYKDPKRRQEETIKLYREAGVNPAGLPPANAGATAHLDRPLPRPDKSWWEELRRVRRVCPGISTPGPT